ncbi:putative P2Y purinoceptor 10 [Pelodiscus sinensis]|uniref:Putative P2Y purinoceptor 10 n=2 Tax=Pelodiscus sinensis TaxID=13735 RepID=K7EX11_PELSI|nr:putative P2Y purinoceptor 10 [Pelodiscus sinensis]XP_014424305.1 putative P2Y purinoceptor 10 [Pelodiscus sinensis]|eukprot:XP_006113726.1 putative P2Y purinoceptor 10 [Pelodiscus sinensis]
MSSNSSSGNCTDPDMGFQTSLYATTYIIIFIPGLLANSAALWVLCRFISKKNKAIIFMINLSVADLAHVLSLPLRVYYYINHVWPFGSLLCQFCFYLKYLNMYTSICFLTCISIQRYLFLLYPFKAKNWKSRYDIAISAAVWIFVGAACSPVLILRSSTPSNNTITCFADLKIKQMTMATSITLVTVAELSGFVIPLVIIAYCTWKMRQSLQESEVPLQQRNEKEKALRMILMCAAVFFICFTPYHINFPLFMMVKQNVITNCSILRSTLHFHPVSLCLASLNCCLDPILYYFMTSEFQKKLLQCSDFALRSCLMDKESDSSFQDHSDDFETQKHFTHFKCWSVRRFWPNKYMEAPPTEPERLSLQYPF